MARHTRITFEDGHSTFLEPGEVLAVCGDCGLPHRVPVQVIINVGVELALGCPARSTHGETARERARREREARDEARHEGRRS